MTFFRVQARVKGSYEIVLCAIMKQVKHFQETGYRDGRIGAEMVFEKSLQVCLSLVTVTRAVRLSVLSDYRAVQL